MTQSVLTDAELVDRVIAGLDGAFDELYRRHLESAWRVAQSVTGNTHDASDAVSAAFAKVLQSLQAGRLEDGAAFRSHLLTATRDAGLDILRRSGTLRSGEKARLDPVAGGGADAEEHVAGAADATLVAESARNLPERWRSVLWLTEVEGVATKDAAATLGLTVDGAAKLAARARARLRERLLEAHLRGGVAPGCRFTLDHLGAYLGGGISPSDLAEVDQHLTRCEACRARKEELEDLGTTLRRTALPIPLALAGAAGARVAAALASSSAPADAADAAGRVLELATSPTPFMRRVAGASAATVLTLGVLSLPFARPDDADVPTFANRAPAGAASGAASEDARVVNLPTATLAESTSTPGSAGSTPVATALPVPTWSGTELALAPAPAPAPAPATAPEPSTTHALTLTPSTPTAGQEPEPTPSPSDDGDTGTAPASADVGIGVNVGDHSASLTLVPSLDPAIGISIDDLVIGTAPTATPEEPGITILAGPFGTIPLP